MKILQCDKCGDRTDNESYAVGVVEDARIGIVTNRIDVEDLFKGDLCHRCVDKIKAFIKGDTK